MKIGKLSVAALTVASLALTSCTAGSNSVSGEESYNWDFTVTVSDTSSWYAGASRFAESLEEKSDGRIQVSVFANEQLSGGDAIAGLEQMMDGGKALSYSSTINYSGIDPRFGAINAPFLYESYEEADSVTKGAGLEAYRELAAEYDVQLLGFGESGFRQITNSKLEILAPEDLQGLKIRVPGSSLFTNLYSQLGADPIAMDFAEVFTSLQNGTIDGQENPSDVIFSNGISEAQEYMTLWNYIYDPLILGMNKDLYDSLSAEDQQLVDEAAAEANKLQIADNRKREAEQIAQMRKTMTVSELDAKQLAKFRKAANPIYDRFESDWTPELIDTLRPGK